MCGSSLFLQHRVLAATRDVLVSKMAQSQIKKRKCNNKEVAHLGHPGHVLNALHTRKQPHDV